MKRYILTGAPGAGKTVLLRALERAGHRVVEEAATDVIALAQAEGVATPWTEPGFIDAIVTLQRQRQARAGGEVVFFDRSPVCALALARFLGHPISPLLRRTLDEMDGVYARRVFLVRGLGFITPTAARQISLDEAARFETAHREAYRERGFDLEPIAPAPPSVRAAAVLGSIKEP